MNHKIEMLKNQVEFPTKDQLFNLIRFATVPKNNYNKISKLESEEFEHLVELYYKPLELLHSQLWEITNYSLFEMMLKEENEYASYTYDFDSHFDRWIDNFYDARQFATILYTHMQELREQYKLN